MALQQEKRLADIFYAVNLDKIVLNLVCSSSSVSNGFMLTVQTCQRIVLELWGTLMDVSGHVYIVELRS